MIIIEKDENLVIPVGINPNISTSNDTKLQSKTVDSSTAHQSVTPDSGYDGLSSVEVNPYTLDSSSALIEQNGNYVFSPVHDGLSSVTVDVSIDSRVAQSKTVDSSTANQTVVPDEGYNALTSVTVNGLDLDPIYNLADSI